MASTLTGLNIGNADCKFAYRSASGMKLAYSRLPENMMESDRMVAPESMSTFIKEQAKKHGIKPSHCALVLPKGSTFFRHVSMPMMTVDELKLNLPYEFRDYIDEEPENYYYDYIVANPAEEVEEGQLDLFAACVKKETIDTYAAMLRKAGFKLTLALPNEVVYERFMQAYVARTPSAALDPIAFMDIGAASTTVTLFQGDQFLGSRYIESGCRDIEHAIADDLGVDDYTAGTYVESNFNNVLDSEVVQTVYVNFCTEVNKVINFHNFSNPEANLSALYLLGGGSQIPQLVETMNDQVILPIMPLRDLFPPEMQNLPLLESCALAASVTIGH